MLTTNNPAPRHIILLRWALLVTALGASAVAAAASSADGNIARSLERRVVELFEDMHSLPVAMKRDGGNVEVRVRSDGGKNRVTTFGEAKRTNLHPDRFRPFLQRFADDFPRVNTMVESVEVLETDGRNGGREGVKSVLNFPFPLSDRIMIHWKYQKLGRNGDEHMLFLSEEGNEELLKKYHTPDERKKYVLGRTFLCAYWIKPVRDTDSGRVVGSTVQYLFSGDTGGNMPKSVQNLVGPKAALDSVQGLIQHAKMHKPWHQAV